MSALAARLERLERSVPWAEEPHEPPRSTMTQEDLAAVLLRYCDGRRPDWCGPGDPFDHMEAIIARMEATRHPEASGYRERLEDAKRLGHEREASDGTPD